MVKKKKAKRKVKKKAKKRVKKKVKKKAKKRVKKGTKKKAKKKVKRKAKKKAKKKKGTYYALSKKNLKMIADVFADIDKAFVKIRKIKKEFFKSAVKI